MKRLGSLLMIISATLLFACCSNELDDIFNGNNKEAIAPLADNLDTSTALSKVDKTLVLMTMGGIVDMSKGIPTCAVIINSRATLDAALQAGMVSSGKDRPLSEWPEIDFNQYSLVLEIVYVSPSYWMLGSQRILNKKPAPELYLEIISTTPANAVRSTDVKDYYMAKLYPKILFEGEIKTNTWTKAKGN